MALCGFWSWVWLCVEESQQPKHAQREGGGKKNLFRLSRRERDSRLSLSLSLSLSLFRFPLRLHALATHARLALSAMSAGCLLASRIGMVGT